MVDDVIIVKLKTQSCFNVLNLTVFRPSPSEVIIVRLAVFQSHRPRRYGVDAPLPLAMKMIYDKAFCNFTCEMRNARGESFSNVKKPQRIVLERFRLDFHYRYRYRYLNQSFSQSDELGLPNWPIRLLKNRDLVVEVKSEPL